MLFTIAALLIILWLLGMVSSYTLGRFHPHSIDTSHHFHTDTGHPRPQSRLTSQSFAYQFCPRLRTGAKNATNIIRASTSQ
jgi:hypothetical protein